MKERRAPKKPLPNSQRVRELTTQGYKNIVGLDEVGRGAWAGPLVMGAVLLDPGLEIAGLRDSKQLTPAQREALVPQIHSLARAWSLGIVEVEALNQLGLGRSLELAAQRALAELAIDPDYLLFDGKYPLRSVPIAQEAIVRGDGLVASIAAASVIAKVYRDRLMRELHLAEAEVASYRFDLNKGYPSAWHRQSLKEHGPSRHHRTCFAPIAALKQPTLW